MGNSMMIFGNANMKPGASSPEHAAAEFFDNRVSVGSYALKPPIHRWAKDQRERFEKELERLEKENAKQKREAAEFATRDR